MTVSTLESILLDLKKSRHAGLNSDYTCDLMKIGSPGRPYRNCTCGLDDRIAKIEEEIRRRRKKGKSK